MIVCFSREQNVVVEESREDEPEDPSGTSPTGDSQTPGAAGEEEGLYLQSQGLPGKAGDNQTSEEACAEQKSGRVPLSHDQL